MSELVTLTTRELLFGGMRGLLRQVEAIHEGAKNRNCEDVGKEWQQHIFGALAEVAVSRLLGRYWEGMSTRGAADVEGVEVRATEYPTGHLRIYHRDHDDRPYVLALTHQMPTVVVVGYLFGREGKLTRYWNEQKNVFWVPQSALHTSVLDLKAGPPHLPSVTAADLTWSV